MVRRIEALHFRSLRYVAQDLGPFHVLVGPNASGKTTFLDTLAFLGDLVSVGLEEAIERRSSNLRDLIWRREADRFELAVELAIPEDRAAQGEGQSYDRCRYEVAVGVEAGTEEAAIQSEKVVLLSPPQREEQEDVQRTLFPMDHPAPAALTTPRGTRGAKTVVNKVPGGYDKFYDETGTGWDHTFKLGHRKSALANLPEDETRFAVATWLKGLLMDGVQRLAPDATLMRRPCPPGRSRSFRPDGSNLPWVVADLERSEPTRVSAWLEHLRTCVPDLEAVGTVERQEDRHRYLSLRYRNGLEVPSWMMPDGVLRLMALTLPGYLPGLGGIYLVEEPENGIHPRAVGTVYQALRSVSGAQVLVATYSPVILSLAEVSQVLCFSRTEEGATDVVPGAEHPALRDWRGETSLGALFAEGVLG